MQYRKYEYMISLPFFFSSFSCRNYTIAHTTRGLYTLHEAWNVWKIYLNFLADARLGHLSLHGKHCIHRKCAWTAAAATIGFISTRYWTHVTRIKVHYTRSVCSNESLTEGGINYYMNGYGHAMIMRNSLACCNAAGTAFVLCVVCVESQPGKLKKVCAMLLCGCQSVYLVDTGTSCPVKLYVAQTLKEVCGNLGLVSFLYCHSNWCWPVAWSGSEYLHWCCGYCSSCKLIIIVL